MVSTFQFFVRPKAIFIAVGIGIAITVIPVFVPFVGSDSLYAPARLAVGVLGEHHSGDVMFPSFLEIVVGCGTNVLAWAVLSYGVFLIGSFVALARASAT